MPVENDELQIHQQITRYPTVSSKSKQFCEIAEVTPAEEEDPTTSVVKLKALVLGFKVRATLRSQLAETFRYQYIHFHSRESQIQLTDLIELIYNHEPTEILPLSWWGLLKIINEQNMP